MNQRFFSTKMMLGLAVWMAWPALWAQIYSCTDASGRRLTSDRPIAECLSKEQRELNPSGTTKRVVKPVLTADEQRQVDQQDKTDSQARARQEEDRRKNRALLARYPNKAEHDKERVYALSKIDEVINAAQKRIGELAAQRKKINEELEFYRKDPAKLPPALREQLDDNERSIVAQRRFITDQDAEKRRTITRFDQELERLQKLWAHTDASSSGAAASAQSSASTPSSALGPKR